MNNAIVAATPIVRTFQSEGDLGRIGPAGTKMNQLSARPISVPAITSARPRPTDDQVTTGPASGSSFFFRC
jgi:hypothetical protein